MMLKKINVAVLFALGVLLSAPGSAADRSAPSEELPGDAPESDVSVKFHALDYSQSVMNLSQGSSEKRLNDMRGELISLDVEEDTLKHRLRQALRDNPEAAKAVEKADLEAKSRPSVNISLDDALDRKIQLELAPPTPEVAEKEKDGQEVKPDAEGVRNVPSQHTEEAPQIRSPANDRSPSGNFIADHIVIGRPGISFRDENKPKGLKM